VQAEANAKAAEDPAGSRILEAANLKQPKVPVVEAQVPTGAAGADQTAPELEVADSAIPEVKVTRRAPGQHWVGDEPGHDNTHLRMPAPGAGGFRAEAGRNQGRVLVGSRH
jgi:hypothetical protein